MANDLKSLAAQQAGLPAGMADRLRGETLSELTADAERFRQALGLLNHAQRRKELERLRDVARINPEKFNRLVDEGKIVDLSSPPAAAIDPNAARPDSAREPAPDRGSFDAGHRRDVLPSISTMDEFRALAERDPVLANDLVDSGKVNLRALVHGPDPFPNRRYPTS
jgi:hypothetical protein